jgi:ABC-2 type transport system permease protein
MLQQILAMTWKDLKIFLKDHRGVIIIFVQPFIFILLMSYGLSGLYRSGDRPIQILAVNQDRGTQATAILRQLGEMKAFKVETTWEGQPVTRQKAEQLIIGGKRTYALVFPPDFSLALEEGPAARAREGQTTKVLCIADPATSSQFVEPILGTLQGLIERASYTAKVPQGVDYIIDQLAPQLPAAQRESFRARAEEGMSGGLIGGPEPAVTVERASPTGMQTKKLPNVFQQNVPGYTIYGIFWIVTLLGLSVLREKREGTFRRLLLAPMSRMVLLAGKLMPYYLINIVQIAIMLGVSSLLFKMSLGNSPMGLVLVSLTAAATATGLGVLVAALARTEAQIGGLTILVLLTLSAMGGCFVPRFIMPDWLRTVGLATPHAWALDAYQDLFVRGYGLFEVLPKVGVLAIFAVAFFAIGVWRFRFE